MQPGTRLGPYEIIDAIGKGGMGEVYRARDMRLERQVAIKTLAADAIGDARFHARFEREARAVAALSHPNILAIHDVGVHDGIPYIAVELLEGETLRSRIGPSPLPLATILDYAAQIGRGLAAAHGRGIVHRDLKPENVFVTREGQIKLLDFGLATEPERETADDATRPPQTDRAVVLGTAGYMSPEQARGERIDLRSDIFSFGCVLYEMLSARRAFTGDSRVETLHAILKEQPPDLSGLRPGIPPALDRVVRRCLEKAPESRFQTARDLVFAVETLADPVEARPSGTASAPTSQRRVKWIAAAMLAGAVASGAGMLSWTVLRNRTPPPSSAASATAAEGSHRLLAVLPFENISRAGEGYFAAGMTEESANQLSKLSGLRVVSRAALAAFNDPRAELARMVQELGVGSLVAGTVREDGARVRVNVELIDARSGQVRWSEQYDREGVDVFAAQSDIALRVASVLNASVTLDERARLGKPPTSSVAAYELFVRARTPPGKTTEERFKNAHELLRQAITLDPKFAAAYSEIARRSSFEGSYWGNREALGRGLDAAHKALAIDPQLPDAYHGLAANLHMLGRLQEALVAYRKAVELNPSFNAGLTDLSFGEAVAGHCDEALKYAKRAYELTPNGGALYYHGGVALQCLDDDARTERVLTLGAARFPNETRIQTLLAFLDLRRGQPEAAVTRIRALADKAPNNIEVQLTRAEILTFAGTADAPEIVRALYAEAANGLFHNAPYPVKLAHAYHLQRAGATAEAAKIMEEIAAANRESMLAGADWPLVFMQNAAIRALRGETAAALDELDRGYAAGWRDGRTLAIDPLVASLRAEPRFKQLLSRIEADVAVMRGRADYSGLP